MVSPCLVLRGAEWQCTRSNRDPVEPADPGDLAGDHDHQSHPVAVVDVGEPVHVLGAESR